MVLADQAARRLLARFQLYKMMPREAFASVRFSGIVNTLSEQVLTHSRVSNDRPVLECRAAIYPHADNTSQVDDVIEITCPS